MKIENNSTPYFGANLIRTTKIPKLIENTSSYKDVSVSFVKIDVKNDGDHKALENIAKYWENANFATNIYHAACTMKKDSEYNKYNQIYSLSIQNSDFENLDDEKILGLVHVCPLTDKFMFIERIIANPTIINEIKRKYDNIGTAMLDMLKTFNDKLACFPSNTKSVKNFYRKNNFIEMPDNTNLFIWNKYNN